jgi:hypothetical protein
MLIQEWRSIEPATRVVAFAHRFAFACELWARNGYSTHEPWAIVTT